MDRFLTKPQPKAAPTLQPHELRANMKHSRLQSITIDYPWPVITLPPYNVGRYGRWKVDRTPEHVAQGFYLPKEKNEPGYALFRMSRGRWPKHPWMSFTAMERQSHMPHVYSATGDCINVGLGMGMYLFNIINKPEVTSVVVIEKDQDVINLFNTVASPEKWENWHKVTILNKDVFQLAQDEIALLRYRDHLYIDIWEKMFDDKAYLQAAQVFDTLQPKNIGWWTMEGDFASWAFKKLSDSEQAHDRELIDHMYEDWAEYIRMPVVCQDVEHMGSLSAAAMISAVARIEGNSYNAGQLQLRVLHLLGAYKGVIKGA